MFYAADARADHRRRACHRLHRRDTERFVPWRGHENIGCAVVVTQYVATTPADEAHAIGYAGIRGHALQPTDLRRRDRTRTVGFSAGDNEQRIEFVFAAQLCDRAYYVVD